MVDFVLTERGRKLYARGQLDFTYFSLLDDGIHYDPYVTGTMTDSDRDVQVSAQPMWEAPLVRDTRLSVAPLEPTGHLFTAGDGYRTVPQMVAPSSSSQLSLMCDQVRDGDAYKRSGTSTAQIDLAVSGEAESVNPGFQVRVFSSGTQGLVRLRPRTDLAGRRALDPFIAVVIDDERMPDGPSVDSPASSRRPALATGIDQKSHFARSK